MADEPRPLERRPIARLNGLYEITRSGMVWSVRGRKWMAYTPAQSGAPYIEVSIDGKLQRVSIARAVMEAWGETSQLHEKQKRWFDTDEIQDGDYVIGTYLPARQWRQRMRRPTSEADRGRRGLFQVMGKVKLEDNLPGYLDDWMVSPREAGWSFDRCPLLYLRDLEPGREPSVQQPAHPDGDDDLRHLSENPLRE